MHSHASPDATDFRPADPTPSDIFAATTAIVVAAVSAKLVFLHDVPHLIETVHSTLAIVVAPPSVVARAIHVPAVSIDQSVTGDYLVCLEDGRRFKSLRRHLSGLGMTPEQYRAKWDLPRDYPMVAPNYVVKRSEMAKQAGLGTARNKITRAA